MVPTSLRVIVIPSGVQRRARKLEEKRWMRGKCYFSRVDKKWMRKYGFIWVETVKRGQVFVSEALGYVMCRREDYDFVTKALNAGHIPQSKQE